MLNERTDKALKDAEELLRRLDRADKFTAKYHIMPAREVSKMANRYGRVVSMGLVSLLTGLASCEHKPNPAESFYQAFPDATHLLGAGNVEKYETPGAKHCLVHIKQVHRMDDVPSIAEQQNAVDIVEKIIAEPQKYSPVDVQRAKGVADKLPVVKKSLAEARSEIRASIDDTATIQRDIYRILTALNHSYGVHSLRAEGLERNLSREECINVAARVNTDLQTKGYLTEDEATNSLKYIVYPGAEFATGGAGILEIKAGESKELNEVAIKALDLFGKNNLNAAEIHNPREDYVLKLVSEEKEPYSVTVFGAEHDFRDNVEKWNKEHPRDKFSLIVVTPASYQEKNK